MQGDQKSQPEKAQNRYGGSYLAMEAANKRGLPQPGVQRRRGAWFVSRLKELVLLIVILGAAGYVFRARLIPVLAGNAYTLPIAQFIEEKFPGKKKKEPVRELSTAADVADGAVAKPAGGEMTFSSGQGFGTVAPDDGSDKFRVVVPPEEEKPRR